MYIHALEYNWEGPMGILRRSVITGIGGIAALGAGGALVAPRLDPVPPEAIAAWRGPAAGETDPRRRALAWAITAPNPHNMQAWQLDLASPDIVRLHVDLRGLLPETDPFARQVVIGHGCFLELLALAAAAEGWHTDIALFPRGEFPRDKVDERPVAEIRFARQAATADPLAAQIPHRRSTKTRYAERPLGAAHHTALHEVHGQQNPIALTLQSVPDSVDALRALARAGSELEMNLPRTHGETVERLRVGTDEIARHRDGLTLAGPAVWASRQLGLMSREALMTPGSIAWQSGVDYVMAAYADRASFGWLTTPDNSRAAQIAVGRAYVRLNLAASGLGVAMQPHSQTLQEFPEMADLNRRMRAATATPEGHTLQMFFRLGYAAQPQPKPRRALDGMIRA
jgi:hypothetical protein